MKELMFNRSREEWIWEKKAQVVECYSSCFNVSHLEREIEEVLKGYR